MATMYYRPYTSQPIKDDEFPPLEAMETVLPEYQYIFVDPDESQGPKPRAPAPAVNRSTDVALPVAVIDHQMREIENYRTAVHKMGQDILELRQQIRDLDTNNSQLRRDISHYNDSTKFILDSVQMDGLTKAELAERYGSQQDMSIISREESPVVQKNPSSTIKSKPHDCWSSPTALKVRGASSRAVLKQKLASQTAELKTYKDKVQKLQNDLIKKNDQEKQFIQMSHAHSSQNEVMQKLQEKSKKVKKLEEGCRKQELIIQKMETLIERNRNSLHPDSVSKDTNEVLMEENRRLRSELEIMKDQQPSSRSDDVDRLELYQQLERAQGRISSLEQQLKDNSRHWGKERGELMIKLNEAQNGFTRVPGMVLHDFPLNTADSYDNPRRYTKASPRKRSPKTLHPIS